MFGEQTKMFEELTTYGDDYGVTVIVLTPGDLALGRSFRYQSGSWARVSGVFPDIVLRRSGVFTHKPASALRELTELRKLGLLHTLPRQSGNKWSLYRWLSRDPFLRCHVPRTSLCTSGKQLYAALQSRPDVYLKPPGGSRGVSIYHLERRGRDVVATWERRLVARTLDQVSTDFRPETETVTRSFRNEAACLAFWQEIGLHRAIVQDAVKLPRKDGSPFDFRWLVCDSEDPVIVARVGRMGRRDAVTTNIHTGGQAVSAKEFIELAVGAKRSDAILRTMDEVTERLAQRLGARHGAFAEVGIDLAVTEQGDIYVFEVNPTPGRRMLRLLDADLHRLSLASLLEYVITAVRRRGQSAGRES
ncbi:YheC/YheD family protein [Alicyclobacillus sacchari]|uniref:YheC/YheD family protein n=1 Tax=Alicyclobacillus sacchari TaxID=392010 RepID=UPI0024E07C21|nr:YheC/YheD family protein [Alicyclobacillus sacchari]